MLNNNYVKDKDFLCLSNSIISKKYIENTRALKVNFLKKGYVELPGLLNNDVLNIIHKEVNKLRKYLVQKDFIMPNFKTPRKLSTIGGSIIKKYSLPLTNLYTNPSLINFINHIVGEEIFLCKHKEEWMVVNYMSSIASTHGWHLDDPEYALIIILEMHGEGGNVEIINTANMAKLVGELSLSSISQNIPIIVSIAKQNNLIYSNQFRVGSAYLLRAGKCLHRVSELISTNALRIAINMAFENTSNPSYNETADLLYGNNVTI